MPTQLFNFSGQGVHFGATYSLRMLVNGVTVHQNEDKSLDVSFEMNGDFADSTSIMLEAVFEEVV